MKGLLQRLDNITRLLELQTSNQKDVFTAAEAAAYMGMSTSNFYKLTSSRVIPHSKPNSKLIYVKRADCDQFMTSNPVPLAVTK